MKANEVLETALDLITGNRDKQNGSALKNHENIALLWSAYRREKFTPVDVALMMVLLKVARTQSGVFNADDFIDAAGYAAIAGAMAPMQPKVETWVHNHGYHG